MAATPAGEVAEVQLAWVLAQGLWIRAFGSQGLWFNSC